MNTFTSLTIAIPTYKRCETVVSLVNSLLPQLRDGDELLVVDDASFDGTSEALRSIDKVRLITKTLNEGMVKNWNTCLTSASNDWICIIHDDDKPLTNALETIRKACSIVNKPALIGHQSNSELDDCFRYQVTEPGAWAALQNFLPSGVTLHKAIIETLGVFDEKYAYSPDLEYFSRIRSKYPSITIESPKVLLFNLHSQNFEYSTWIKSDFFTQLEEIEKLIVSYSGLPDGLASECFHKRINGHIKWILNHSKCSEAQDLLKIVGKTVRNKPYLSRGNRLRAYIASFLNWSPEL